jgi:endogenous inhibitor of DNA gyrase (YacG/DUF329 family)
MIRAHCPICEEELAADDPLQLAFFPFCGERCRLIDLGRWLGEKYRMPSERDREKPVTPEDGDRGL